tara:strand:+ start:1835 stop:2464 length:630 start_codon:yes stop_codon:yes gene_type:complete
MNINKMIRSISNIAVAKGLVDSDWPGKLKVKLRNGRGIPCGGKRGGYPFISIPLGIGWDTTPDDVTAKAVKSWEQSRPCPRRTRALQRLKNADAGLATWEEYASINDDPEIGRLLGDPSDTRAPMAALLCHEIAHAIDFTAGAVSIAGIEYGTGDRVHGKRWQAIYRVLRNAYVASGAYKPVAKIVPLPSKKTRAPLELIGLPLFAAAA